MDFSQSDLAALTEPLHVHTSSDEPTPPVLDSKEVAALRQEEEESEDEGNGPPTTHIAADACVNTRSSVPSATGLKRKGSRGEMTDMPIVKRVRMGEYQAFSPTLPA